ncbi:MAG: ABC transporter ATP-binding protein [Candidatus Woesearchaeota archaeon]
MLKIQNLTKKFGSFVAVKDINLEIKKGEFCSIIGPNGSGKTTIIKNVLGLLKPTEGDVIVDGASILKDPIKAKQAMGYIPDEPKIWNHITGEEYLYFSGILYGMKRESIKAEIPKLLSYFNLDGIEKEYFDNYSRGNRQKFTILAALLHRPSLILVDEPIVGLDPSSADIAMELLLDFTKSGGTVFMSTHTLSVAEKYSSKIALLHKGAIKDVGSLADLRKKFKKKDASLLEIYYKAIEDDK